MVSSPAGGSRRGVHDSTGAGPRTTNGAMGPTPNAPRPRAPARSPGCSERSARLSQPVSAVPGLPSPLSSTSWPSKWERSR